MHHVRPGRLRPRVSAWGLAATSKSPHLRLWRGVRQEAPCVQIVNPLPKMRDTILSNTIPDHGTGFGAILAPKSFFSHFEDSEAVRSANRA